MIWPFWRSQVVTSHDLSLSHFAGIGGRWSEHVTSYLCLFPFTVIGNKTLAFPYVLSNTVTVFSPSYPAHCFLPCTQTEIKEFFILHLYSSALWDYAQSQQLQSSQIIQVRSKDLWVCGGNILLLMSCKWWIFGSDTSHPYNLLLNQSLERIT